MNNIAQLFSQLKSDEWRSEVGFTKELEMANSELFSSSSKEKAMTVVGEWLQKHQPCLFGRIAARLGALSYCILTETEMQSSDEDIKKIIQDEREQWTRQAFEGKKSGFVILVVSKQIAYATPDKTMQELARRLCSLYLETDIALDQVHLDEIFLEKPGDRRTTWRWYAGVNYFCAHADKRWWQDHRIPGGMAFSVNSVGHMVKSEIIARKMKELDQELQILGEGLIDTKINSLGKALEVAMRTISLAANTPWGRATELLPLPADRRDLPVCPIALPAALADKDFTKYRAYYHTDHTLPSDYFLPDESRNSDTNFTLDFTYLFHKNIANPDFTTMGEGKQIRADTAVPQVGATPVPLHALSRRVLAESETIAISQNQRLMRALSRPRSKTNEYVDNHSVLPVSRPVAS
jgi:hypothetical protein